MLYVSKIIYSMNCTVSLFHNSFKMKTKVRPGAAGVGWVGGWGGGGGVLDEIGLALVLRALKPGPAVSVAGNAVNLP